jgi:hypothetical protein
MRDIQNNYFNNLIETKKERDEGRRGESEKKRE